MNDGQHLTPEGEGTDGRLRLGLEAALLGVAGAVVFVAGTLLGKSWAQPLIQVIGAAGVLLAPLIWRTEGILIIGPKGITIPLRGRTPRGRAVLATARAPEERIQAILDVVKAPHRELAGILPFLSQDVSAEILTAPASVEGRRLKDLPFVRQEFQVAVVALRHPGGSEWIAGGEITETPILEGTELLACGPPESMTPLRQRLAEPDETTC